MDGREKNINAKNHDTFFGLLSLLRHSYVCDVNRDSRETKVKWVIRKLSEVFLFCIVP